MQPGIVLVAGPLVGASSWEPTASRLRAEGVRVQIPDVLACADRVPPWREWTSHLLDLSSAEEAPILIGHSSASTLIVDLATKMKVRGVIITDGDIPPASGLARPVRPALGEFIAGLADENGLLPPWSQWWVNNATRARLVGIDVLERDPQALRSFEMDLPRMNLGWFDDAINLSTWDHIPAGYIQLSPIYDHAAEEASRRAWPLRRLQGTHRRHRR